MFCNNCGQQLENGAVFCPNCGQKVNQGNAVPPQGNQVPPQGNPVPPQYNTAPNQNGQQGNPVPPQGNAVPPQGNPVPPQGNQVPPQGNPVPPQYNTAPNQNQTAPVNAMFQTTDHTAEFHPQAVKDGKVMSILAYIGILVLIPLFAEKNNPYVRFHVNQGFVLFILSIAASIVSTIFMFIPVFGAILVSLVSLAQLALMIIGIVNAATDSAKELPVIGKFKWIS